MKFFTVADAAKQNLIRSTHWLVNTPEDRQSLQSAHDQVMLNPLRKAILVQGKDFRIALFVDDVSGKVTRGERGPRVQKLSASGKYKSIRHLAEVIFSKTPDLDVKKWQTIMKREYPKSESAGIKCYGHYCWYKHHIVSQGRFTFIPVPSWFKAKGNGKAS